MTYRTIVFAYDGSAEGQAPWPKASSSPDSWGRAATCSP